MLLLDHFEIVEGCSELGSKGLYFAPLLIELRIEKVDFLYLFFKLALVLFQSHIFVVEELQALLAVLKILVGDL